MLCVIPGTNSTQVGRIKCCHCLWIYPNLLTLIHLHPEFLPIYFLNYPMTGCDAFLGRGGSRFWHQVSYSVTFYIRNSTPYTIALFTVSISRQGYSIGIDKWVTKREMSDEKKGGFRSYRYHQTMLLLLLGLSPWGYSPGIACARVCVCVCV